MQQVKYHFSHTFMDIIKEQHKNNVGGMNDDIISCLASIANVIHLVLSDTSKPQPK